MNFLILNAYPGKTGLTSFLANEHYKKLKKEKKKVKIINLYGLKFDKTLHEGYKSKQEIEKDLIHSKKLINWADEIVFFYPIWWGEMPSLLRSFIERIFVPEFAFRYTEKGRIKLLKGKTAKIFATAGGPKWYYNTIGFIDQKRTLGRILNFCGIKTNSIKLYGGVRNSMSQRYKTKIIKSLEKF